jgi:acetyl-CoA acyltransferase
MQRGLNYARRGFATSSASKRVVVVDGARIPFTMAGTTYSKYLAVDLQRFALKGLMDKTALDPNLVDYILCGTVIQETRTSNIAREAALGAGFPTNVACHTITMACISSNQCITTGAEKILAGQADVVVCGGTETFSDVPIRFSKPIRKRFLGAAKAMKKGPMGALSLLRGLKLKDLAPEAPAIANFTTGEVMGHSSDRLSARFDVSRTDQDEFAVRSHHRAAAAHAEGLYKDEIIPVDGMTEENGIKGDTSMEKMGKLKPAFIKPHGTHTAANSSYLTDGASACLIMSEDMAKKLGYKPKAYLHSWTYVASDPFEELLLGPTYATNKVLSQAGLTLNDMGVVEIHEAFAGQVLSNVAAMGSERFAQDHLPGGKMVGKIDWDRTNTLGGSLSLGHPFGATGARLVTTVANRLQREDQKYGLLTACADGGLATAAILEKC